MNGGVAKYRAAFFTDDFIYASPQYMGALERLAGLLAEQVNLLQVTKKQINASLLNIFKNNSSNLMCVFLSQ